MNKIKSVLKKTTNTHVYKRARILLVTGCCMACKRRHRKDLRSWKNYRKSQWEK